MLQNIGDKLKSQRWLAYADAGRPGAGLRRLGRLRHRRPRASARRTTALKVNGEKIRPPTRAAGLAAAPVAVPAAAQAEIPRRSGQQLQQAAGRTVRAPDAAAPARATERGFRVSDDAAGRRPTSRDRPSRSMASSTPAAARGMLAQVGMTHRRLRGSSCASSLQVAAADAEPADHRFPDRHRAQAHLRARERAARSALRGAAGGALRRGRHGRRGRDPGLVHGARRRLPEPESVRLQYAELRLDDVARRGHGRAAGAAGVLRDEQGRYAEAEKRHAQPHPRSQVVTPTRLPDAAALKKAQDVLRAGASRQGFRRAGQAVFRGSGLGCQRWRSGLGATAAPT